MTAGRTRFLLEIVFLIAVAGAAAAFHWGPAAVAAAMGGAFVLVVAVEISSLRTERGPKTAEPPGPAAPRPAPPREETWVEALERLGRRAAPGAAAATEADASTRRLTLPTQREAPTSPPRPAPAPASGFGPQAPQLRAPRRREEEPAPPVFQPPTSESPPPVVVPEAPREPTPAPPVQPVTPEPVFEPARAAVQPPVSAPPRAEPPPAPVEPPAPTPPPPPIPEPAPQAPVEARPEPVRPAAAPVQWNLFELQSRARQIAGRDPARDEEWSFLFLYLREFAGTDGLLSADFDSFVRESFPELISGL